MISLTDHEVDYLTRMLLNQGYPLSSVEYLIDHCDVEYLNTSLFDKFFVRSEDGTGHYVLTLAKDKVSK